MTLPQTIASLTEELQRLRTLQADVIALAVYVGMSKEVTLQFEQRKERISEIYLALSALGVIRYF